MAVDQGTYDSVATSNMKSLGDGPAFFQNQMYQLAVDSARSHAAHQARLNNVVEIALANILTRVGGFDPAEAKSVTELLTGDSTAKKQMELIGALATAMQAVKAGAATPPASKLDSEVSKAS